MNLKLNSRFINELLVVAHTFKVYTEWLTREQFPEFGDMVSGLDPSPK